MPIKAYDNIPDSVLDETHTTQNGKTYTIRCDEKLVVDMSFKGKNQPTSNSQGWERNNAKYFQQLHQNHPEMFSAKNTARIQNGQAPIVDQKMIDHNPQFAQFKGEPLAHHHIGGDGQAAAVPRSMHMGYGEIHNHEKKAGITQNCKDFSQKCDNYVQANPNAMGKSSSEMSNYVSNNQANSSSQVAKSTSNTSSVNQSSEKSAQGNSVSSTPGNAQKSNSNTARTEAVNSVLNSSSNQQNAHGNSQGESRSQSVYSTLSGQSHGTSSGHSNTSEGQSSSTGEHSNSSGGHSSSSDHSSSGGHSGGSNDHGSSGGQSK